MTFSNEHSLKKLHHSVFFGYRSFFCHDISKSFIFPFLSLPLFLKKSPLKNCFFFPVPPPHTVSLKQGALETKKTNKHYPFLFLFRISEIHVVFYCVMVYRHTKKSACTLFSFPSSPVFLFSPHSKFAVNS